MKKHVRWSVVALLLVSSVAGCADSEKGQESGETGSLAMPLTSQGQSGVTYRLRRATFRIASSYYYYGSAGAAGAISQTGITVSSETDPNADSIDVEVEAGSYSVTLAAGWAMEKVEGGVTTPVEAQLLSSETQWISISRHSTRWVQYQFGIGDRAIWFNGKLNLDMTIYETPAQYFGSAGAAGNGGYAGYPTVAGNRGY